ncbi:MAG: ATP-binding cassette domain-containing protein, partial [Deltaproteobacteria bacterium]|nr:ATP-binding cassette domain-containing protein [Deltaproteobacteria bacterium]
DRSGAKARSTKQKARIDRAEELRKRSATGPVRDLAFTFEAGQRLGGTVLEASDLTLELGGRTLVRNLSFTLRKGERVGVLGPNGCGKTTLVRALLGRFEPAGGTVTAGKHTRIGYLDQARTGLDDAQRVDEALGEGDWVTVPGPKGDTKRHKAGYLEDFLFGREDQRKPVSILSGGERARLLLARLLLDGANVLVLDEPTNDLDLPTLQVLDEALADFPGSVLMVTHDRYFLDRVATGILHFEGGGRVVFYEGNYEIFAALRAQKREERSVPRAAAPAASAPRARSTRQPSLTYKERLELTDVEGEIGRLEARKREVEAVLAEPVGLPSRDSLQALSQEFTDLESRLEALLGRWEELESKRGSG